MNFKVTQGHWKYYTIIYFLHRSRDRYYMVRSCEDWQTWAEHVLSSTRRRQAEFVGQLANWGRAGI